MCTHRRARARRRLGRQGQPRALGRPGRARLPHHRVCTSRRASASYSSALAAEGRGLRRARAACRCASSTSPPKAPASPSRTSPRRPGARPAPRAALLKRHFFDTAALAGEFDVLATGHNLDDEAARLLGNVLHWQRRSPGPPASGAAADASQVRPQGEAAVSAERVRDRGLRVHARHRLRRRGVPQRRRRDAARLQGRAEPPRGRQPGQQARLRAASSCATGSRCSRPRAATRSSRRVRCARCGMPAWGEVCAFCKLVAEVETQAGARPAPSRRRERRAARRRGRVARAAARSRAGRPPRPQGAHLPPDAASAAAA